MKAPSKIIAAVLALSTLGGVATSADAHPIHTSGHLGGHINVHVTGGHVWRHYGYRHFGVRHYAWHRWGYRRYGTGFYSAAPRVCPPGQHLGYMGRYCWPNHG
jgi:hypothetical protein